MAGEHADKRESRTRASLDYDLQQIASTDLLLRRNLLKVPQPFKTMPKLETKHSKHLSVENFELQTTTLTIWPLDAASNICNF